MPLARSVHRTSRTADIRSSRRDRPSVTLVELHVIIGSLVALVLPAVLAARDAARQAQCVNNLKQLGITAAIFESAQYSFPPGASGILTYETVFRDASTSAPRSSRCLIGILTAMRWSLV
jgi:hypothetical protein